MNYQFQFKHADLALVTSMAIVMVSFCCFWFFIYFNFF
jgi:hypothetical protein